MPKVSSPEWLSWLFWAQNHESIRDLVITIAALVGIPFVIWREWLHHRQTKAALQQTEAALQQAEIAQRQAVTAQLRHNAQVEADRERRITDNFTRAVELLGNDQLETRLGAIYALERIARESQEDHWPIMETLAAYVRERSPLPPLATMEESAEEQTDEARPAIDVQAVLTVIGRRRREFDRVGQRLELEKVDLRGCNLTGAHMEGANFDFAWLDRAILKDAHFEEASLLCTQLERASLQDAHLEKAGLSEANLKRAWCYGIHLEQACLGDTELQGASLMKAHLKETIFCDTHLEGAGLEDTDLTQEQFDSAITDENTRVPPHIRRPGKPAGKAAGVQHKVAAISSKE
jgi:hypothetical protein